MPHTPSAKKSMRRDLKRRLHNRAVIKEIKLQVKAVTTAAEEGTLDELSKAYRLAAKKLDKAAAKRIVHPNMAGRKKSQLAKLLLNKQKAGAAPPAPAAPAKKK
jgi:small subunit ribosomal protein S20